MKLTLLIVTLLCLSGCSSAPPSAGEVATISTAGTILGTLASHVGVNVSVDPTTGAVTGGLVFKDGRWQRVVVQDTRAIGECVDVAPKAVLTPLVTSADIYNFRALVQSNGGVRGITGPILSQRAISRAIALNAKAVQAEERDAFQALKEIHKQEDRRLDTIVHATSQSVGGRIRRVFTAPFTCTSVALTPTPVVVDTTPVVSNPIPDATQPNTLPDSGTMKVLPPSGTMGAQMDERVKALEVSQKAMDRKLDAILAAVKK